MSEPFIAEIRIFAGNFAPRGWAFCDGQLLPIAQNTALFSLIGTTYGGDGRTTTALPNMQGRAPMHPGRGPGLTSRRLGEKVGAEIVTLSEAQIPSHNHTMRAYTQNPAVTAVPSSIESINDPTFATTSDVDMASESLSTTGGGQAHSNVQPFLTLNYIIALQGLFPSRG
ncbi:MAG: tail fiber protein [Chloroflexota bacterium]